MKRKNKTSLFRNIIKALPAFIGVAAVIYVALIIKDIEVSTVLPVGDVQVNGDMAFIDKNEIKSIVEDNISGGFFTVDLNHVREMLLQKPWVKNVSLRRQWPDGIEVFVEERKAIAYWNDDGYISENGNVFKPELVDKDLNLPALNGPEGQHINVLKFMNVLYKEMALLNYAVTNLGLDARRAWRLEIMNSADAASDGEVKGIDVRLGRFDTEKRMQRFIRILPALASEKEFADNKIKVIDMRYPNGFSVRMMSAEKTIVGKSYDIDNLKTQNFSHNFAYEIHRATMQMSEA
ncbi:MAG: cell division protein FtsQ/DivIB [Gammaproteobacteria bacterium]|nr:cell division protein FtsQ/DivIB [Gammaproteobacteria bacterium]